MSRLPATRYAKSGHLSIAYQVFGEGDIDVVFVPGFSSHVEVGWEIPSYADVWKRLASFAQVILFDKRGTGLSDRSDGLPTLAERMDDIRAVMDAVGSERAAVIGVSEGGPAGMLFAATHPQRTTALVLWLSAAGRPIVEMDDEQRASSAYYEEFIERSWGQGKFARIAIGAGAPDDPSIDDLLSRFEMNSATPGAARELWRRGLDTDVRPFLSSVSVPTLVLAHRSDPFIGLAIAAGTANAIPGARLVQTNAPGHWPWDAKELYDDLDVMEEFLTGTLHKRTSERVLATVLYTDIVGSTELASAIGDSRWHDLLEEHDNAIRQELERYRGREVKTTGDGFLAAFDGPARAIECAQTIIRRAKVLGLDVRAGIHAGECEVRGNDLAGIAVHVGARVATLAEAGEVLVSRTVRDLVAGSGLSFDDRGEHQLKGVPGSWQLFAARV